MTPTPPPFGQLVTLGSGTQLLIERSWSWGELFVGLAALALAAWVALDWARQRARGKD